MADATINDNTILELKKLALQGAEVKLPRSGDGVDGEIPFVVVPDGYHVENMEKLIWNEHNHRPQALKQTVNALDAPSFIEYYKLFADNHSRVFADETKSWVGAILDYHDADGTGNPRWGRHRLNLTLRKSREWLIWTGRNGQSKKFEQAEFAEFVEDNGPDFVEPSCATMIELARTLEAKKNVDFQSSLRLSNGQVQFTYQENVNGTFGAGKLEIPEQFVVAIPVYVGMPRERVTARLRWRLNGKQLAIWYDLLRADVLERDAFIGSLEDITDAIGVTIINGVPL